MGTLTFVLRTIDLRGKRPDDYASVVPRAPFDVDHAVEIVRPICLAVASEGRAALARYSEQFDHVVPTSFRVDPAEIRKAGAQLDPQLREAITEAIARRRRVCEQGEREPAETVVELAPGAVVTNKIMPVRRVGLYVPGGLAPLASSVLHNAVPAQTAGVASIAVATPPQREFGGLPHPTVLAVCSMLGIDEVYAVGGAQAVAMFAYGVPEVCPRVDMITGPGNIYVVAAKRLVQGMVAIDAEAGPSEIGILADETANPVFVAADLISQAEHDPMAGAVLITDSTELVASVEAELAARVPLMATKERITTSLTGEQSGVVLVDDMEQGLAVADAYGAEHLEVQTRDARALADRVHNAGAVFVGAYSPVPLGDFSAGSTHVLPTGGAARYSSGLTTRSFMKAVHYIEYSAEALAQIGRGIEIFALAEDLPGHAAVIRARTEGSNG